MFAGLSLFVCLSLSLSLIIIRFLPPIEIPVRIPSPLKRFSGGEHEGSAGTEKGEMWVSHHKYVDILSLVGGKRYRTCGHDCF